MKKFTLLIMSLFLAVGAMAQEVNPANTAYGTRMTPDEFNEVTTSTKIAIECTQKDNYGTFYNGTSKSSTVNDNSIFVMEPVEEGVGGSYYIRKAYSTDANIYWGNSGGTLTWVAAKENAQKFYATSIPEGWGSVDCHYASDITTYGIRITFTEGTSTRWFRINSLDFPDKSATGVWTVQNVYKVAKVTINSVVGEETTTTVDYNKFASKEYTIEQKAGYKYTVKSEGVEVDANATSFIASNANDVTVTVTYTVDDAVAVAMEELKVTVAAADAMAWGTNPGTYKKTEQIDKLLNKAKELISSESKDVDAIEAANANLAAAIENAEINMPIAGKYYNLIGSSSNYMTGQTSTSNSVRAKMCVQEKYDASYVFYYTGNKLVSFSNGYCLDGYAKFAALEASAPVVTFTKTYGTNTATDGTLYMMINANNIHDWSVGDASRTNHTGINTNFDASSCWTIKEVTSLPVTITDAQYATFYAPVAVSMPDEGVTAHTVTISGNSATLSEAIQTVPAEAGVILAGNEGTYYLTITEDVAAIEGALAGTVARTLITKTENTSYYVLGKVGDKVGLYNPVNGTTENQFFNAGHKAYLKIETPTDSNGDNAPAFYGFDFGEGTTGIDEITENRVQSTVIYDLTGRRVEKITEAGIYIVNGKKILVK